MLQVSGHVQIPLGQTADGIWTVSDTIVGKATAAEALGAASQFTVTGFLDHLFFRSTPGGIPGLVGEKIVLAFEEGTINNIGPVVTPTNPGNVGDVLVLTITAIDSGGRFTMSGYPSWPPCTFYGLRVGYVGVNPSEIDFRITGRQFRRGANLG